MELYGISHIGLPHLELQCMYICIYVNMYICICICIYMYIHIHTYIHAFQVRRIVMSYGFKCCRCHHFSEDLKYLRGPRTPSASFCNLRPVPGSDEAEWLENKRSPETRKRWQENTSKCEQWLHTHTYIYIYTCMYIYICIYVYRGFYYPIY